MSYAPRRLKKFPLPAGEVIVIVIVFVFVLALLLAGYDLARAIAGCAAVSAVATGLIRRLMIPAWRASRADGGSCPG